MIKAGIIGATGYAGQQLVWILNNHKEVELEFISSHSNTGEDMGNVYANYKKYFWKKLKKILKILMHYFWHCHMDYLKK